MAASYTPYRWGFGCIICSFLGHSSCSATHDGTSGIRRVKLACALPRKSGSVVIRYKYFEHNIFLARGIRNQKLVHLHTRTDAAPAQLIDLSLHMGSIGYSITSSFVKVEHCHCTLNIRTITVATT